MTKSDIIKHLEANYGKSWIYGGKLAREVRELTGTKESVVERRCRELVNEGILEKQLVQIDGVGARVVQYRVVKEDFWGSSLADALKPVIDARNQRLNEIIEQTEKLNL